MLKYLTNKKCKENGEQVYDMMKNMEKVQISNTPERSAKAWGPDGIAVGGGKAEATLGAEGRL